MVIVGRSERTGAVLVIVLVDVMDEGLHGGEGKRAHGTARDPNYHGLFPVLPFFLTILFPERAGLDANTQNKTKHT